MLWFVKRASALHHYVGMWWLGLMPQLMAGGTAEVEGWSGLKLSSGKEGLSMTKGVINCIIAQIVSV